MRFSLWGMNDWLDGKLFEGFQLPSGMNLEYFTDYVLRTRGELYPFWQVPDLFKNSMINWSYMRLPEWQRMYDALTAEYSPIENYDRHEERDYQERGSDSNSTATSSSEVTTPADMTSTEVKVSAFDANGYVPREMQTTGHSGTIGNIGQQSGSGTINYGKGTKETAHLHGNIGVTTNQAMITEELEVRKNNLYEIIAMEFEAEFILQIYG